MGRIVDVLDVSELAEDRQLAGTIRSFVQRQPVTQLVVEKQRQQREQQRVREQDVVWPLGAARQPDR